MVGECGLAVEGGEESPGIACAFSNLFSLTGDSIGPLVVTRPGSGGISSQVKTDGGRDFRQYFDEALSEDAGEEHRVLVLRRRYEGLLPLLMAGGRCEEAGRGTPWVFLGRLVNGASPKNDPPRM